MNEVYLYFIKSSLCLGILYLIYWVFLRKDTFFQVNRFYLLGALLFSLFTPLINFDFLFGAENAAYTVVLQTITITAGKINETVTKNLDVFQIILIVYLTGAAIFSIRFMIQVIQILLLIKRYGITHYEGMKVVFLDPHFAPFSFFNIIFINMPEKGEAGINEIITHERIHVNQLHTLDLLFLEIATIAQWFNPLIWLYRHSLKSIHEYLADEGVLIHGYEKNKYQNMLFTLTTGIQVNDLTNNFNKSILKRRLIMMTKTKTPRRAIFKLLAVLPVATLLFIFFSMSKQVWAQGKTEKAPQTEKEVKTKVKEDVPPPRKATKLEKDPPPPPPPPQKIKDGKGETYTVVEEMPEFPGGHDGLIKFISSNLVYPDSAKVHEKQGTVYVTYLIEKDGSVSHVKVLRGFDKYCDAEALRVVKMMPKWKPGKQKGKAVRVHFNLPLKFALQ